MLKTRANGPNIVGCFMLRPFAHPDACCCAKFETFYFLSTVRANGHKNSQHCWVGQKFCVCLHRAFLVFLVHVIKTIHAVFSTNKNPCKGHEFKFFASFISGVT